MNNALVGLGELGQMVARILSLKVIREGCRYPDLRVGEVEYSGNSTLGESVLLRGEPVRLLEGGVFIADSTLPRSHKRRLPRFKLRVVAFFHGTGLVKSGLVGDDLDDMLEEFVGIPSGRFDADSASGSASPVRV